jgi:predicted DNA-binding transcriptional regulator AlpA
MQIHEHRKVSAPEAAAYLGISASTLSKLRVFGGGPKFHKLGRRVVYDVRDLDGWFEARQRSSTSDTRDAPTPSRRKGRVRDAAPGDRKAAGGR